MEQLTFPAIKTPLVLFARRSEYYLYCLTACTVILGRKDYVTTFGNSSHGKMKILEDRILENVICE